MREGQIVTTHKEMDAILQELKWPGVVVDSFEFGELPVHERLHQLAIGYVSSAKLLCKELGENPALQTWPHASVVGFCVHHAVELFLKSCIQYRIQKIRRSHNIASLKKQYDGLYPQRAFFFQLPALLCLSEKDMKHLGMGRSHIEDFEKKLDQVYRYLAGMQGHSPKGLYNFGPGAWLWMIEQFEKDIDRIWANIHESEGGA
jgi:hypothetical protein